MAFGTIPVIGINRQIDTEIFVDIDLQQATFDSSAIFRKGDTTGEGRISANKISKRVYVFTTIVPKYSSPVQRKIPFQRRTTTTATTPSNVTLNEIVFVDVEKKHFFFCSTSALIAVAIYFAIDLSGLFVIYKNSKGNERLVCNPN